MSARDRNLLRVVLALAASACLGAAAGGPAVAAPPNVVRTGGPSSPGDPKVAVVAASSPLAGRSFTVVNASGRTVLRGTLRRASGSPKPWRFAATADLSSIRTAGRYRVRSAGLTSRAWVVDPGARSKLIRRLLRLFAVNADGREPNPVYRPAHLNDAIVRGGPLNGQRLDFTGGWRDAGDNLKIAHPSAYAVSLLHLAARLAPGDAAALHSTSDVGVRWLEKLHPRPGAFFVLVGDDRDHGTGFRNPEQDDSNTTDGVGVRHAYPSTTSNVLGSVAAALALAAARSAGARREQLIASAREWYSTGKAANALVKIDDPNVGNYYPDDIFTDDLSFAALQLHRVTGDTQLLAEAKAYFKAAGDGPMLYSGVNTGSIGPVLAGDMCGALGARAPDDEARQIGCEALGKVISAARGRAGTTPFRTPAIITFGSMQDNGGAGALASGARRAGVASDGARIGAGARDYLLGRNAWGASFVVGPGSIDARNPHHGIHLKGSPARLLNGAVVGGPTGPNSLRDFDLRLAASPFRRFNAPSILYEDQRADFVTSEVSLAVSASSVLLAASVGG